jgi:nitrogen-specific signal transduction histidine kinase
VARWVSVRRTPEPSPVIPTQRSAAPSRLKGHLVPVPRHAADRWVDSAPDPTPDFAPDLAPVAAPPLDHPVAPDHSASADPTWTDVRELRGIVHDLGNGLSTMALLLAAARDGSVSTFGLLELIEQETDRLLAVVNSGTAAADPADPVEVRTVLGPIARVAAHVGETSVRLLPGADPAVRVDPAVLSRVVTNLVDNAVRAAGPMGTVRIGVHRAGSVGQDVLIDVIDDGPGFPFGPPGTSRVGLDLVHRLLDACGGRLELRPAAPHGTCARIVLPGLAVDRLPPATC